MLCYFQLRQRLENSHEAPRYTLYHRSTFVVTHDVRFVELAARTRRSPGNPLGEALPIEIRSLISDSLLIPSDEA